MQLKKHMNVHANLCNIWWSERKVARNSHVAKSVVSSKSHSLTYNVRNTVISLLKHN